MDSQTTYKEIVEQGIAHVETIHQLLFSASSNYCAARREAAALLEQGFSTDVAHTLTAPEVQAISHYFQLLNLAEEHVVNHIRRKREVAKAAEAGHWSSYFERIKQLGIESDAVRAKLATVEVSRSSPNTRPRPSAGPCYASTATSSNCSSTARTAQLISSLRMPPSRWMPCSNACG